MARDDRVVAPPRDVEVARRPPALSPQPVWSSLPSVAIASTDTYAPERRVRRVGSRSSTAIAASRDVVRVVGRVHLAYSSVARREPVARGRSPWRSSRPVGVESTDSSEAPVEAPRHAVGTGEGEELVRRRKVSVVAGLAQRFAIASSSANRPTRCRRARHRDRRAGPGFRCPTTSRSRGSRSHPGMPAPRCRRRSRRRPRSPRRPSAELEDPFAPGLRGRSRRRPSDGDPREAHRRLSACRPGTCWPSLPHVPGVIEKSVATASTR